MRLLTFLLFLCFSLSCATSKKTNSLSNALNGIWTPTHQEMGGQAFPLSVLANQKLILSDSTYIVVAESTDKGIVKYNGDKMDIYGKDGVNAGKHFTAIYKLVNDQLTICYNLAGTNYPESYVTAGKPLYFLSVFKKQPSK